MAKNLREYKPQMDAMSDTLVWTDLVPDPERPELLVMDPKTGQRWQRLNERQKLVAQELAAGLRAREACKAAGMKATPETMSRYVTYKLRHHAPFVNYLLTLLERRQRSRVVDLESHLQRLDDLGRRAEKEGKYTAAIAAEVSRGRAAGLYSKDEPPISPTTAKTLKDLDGRIQELLARSQRTEHEVQGRVVSDQDGRG